MRSSSVITIKRGGSPYVQVPITEGCVRRWKLMEQDCVVLQFNLADNRLTNDTSKFFQIGDYIEDELFGLFYITDEPEPAEYDKDSGAYRFNLQFNREYIGWKNQIMMLTYDVEGVSTPVRRETQWTLTDSLENHMEEIMRNLTALGYDGYSYDINEDDVKGAAESVCVTYEGSSILDAIKTLADSYHCEWWVDASKVIHFGKCIVGADGDPIELTLADNVETMTPTRNNSEYANRLYVYGSTKNLPYSYRKRLVFKVTGNTGGYYDAVRPLYPGYLTGPAYSETYHFDSESTTIGTDTSGNPYFQISPESLYTLDTTGAYSLSVNAKLYFTIANGEHDPLRPIVTYELYVMRNGLNMEKIASYEANYTTPISTPVTVAFNERITLTSISSYLYVKAIVRNVNNPQGGTYAISSVVLNATSIVYSAIDVPIDSSIIYNGTTYPVRFTKYTDGTYRFAFTGSTPSGFGVNSEYELVETTESAGGYDVLNIPFSYYTDDNGDPNSVKIVGETRLMLPVGTNYIGESDIPLEQLVEKVVVFEDVYPRCGLRITDLEVSEYDADTEYSDGSVRDGNLPKYKFKAKRIIDSGTGVEDFPFDDRMLLPGVTLEMKFITPDEEAEFGTPAGTAGTNYKLAGMSFGVKVEVSAGKDTIYSIVWNETYGAKLPNTVLKPALNDPFVLSGWNVKAMPTLGLIDSAEEKLEDYGQAYMDALADTSYSFECSMMSDWIYDNGLIDEGQYVKVVHGALKSDKLTRIIGYELKMDYPFDSPKYTAGDTEAYSRLKDIERQLNAEDRNANAASGTISASGGGGGGSTQKITLYGPDDLGSEITDANSTFNAEAVNSLYQSILELIEADTRFAENIMTQTELRTGTSTEGRMVTAKLLADNYSISGGVINIAGNSITPLVAANLKKLTVYAGTNGSTSDTKAVEYDTSSAKSLFIKRGNSGLSISADGTSSLITISHATGGANKTIPAASGKVLSAITVNSYGHVTSVSDKTLAAADIPDLSATYLPLSGGQMSGDINFSPDSNEHGIFFKSGSTYKGGLLYDYTNSCVELTNSTSASRAAIDLFTAGTIQLESTGSLTRKTGNNTYTIFDSGNLTFDNSNDMLSISTPDSSVYTAVNTGYVSSAISTALADYTPTASFAKLTVYSGNGLGDTNVLEYTPAGAANLYIEYDKNGAVELTANGTSHKITVNHKTQGPNTSGNTTISDSTGKVLSAITVNKFGHVTSVAQKTLAAADIPDLSATYLPLAGGQMDAGADITWLATGASIGETTSGSSTYFDISAQNPIVISSPDSVTVRSDQDDLHLEASVDVTISSDQGNGTIYLYAADVYHGSNHILDTGNLPALWGNTIQNNLAAINGPLTFAPVTTASTTAHLEVITVNVNGTPTQFLHTRLPFYSDGDISAFGANGTSGGGGGGGKIQTVYTVSDWGSTFTQNSETDTFNAYAINSLNTRLSTAEGDISDIQDILDNLVGFEVQVVQSLPQTGQNGVIYLMLSSSQGTQDIYDEYVWVDSTSSFEKLGNTAIDLSQYINSVSFASGSSAGSGKAITNFTKTGNSLTFTTGTFLTGITSSMVTTALGFTPFNAANFTQSNIKTTLGISDWALASTKPSYKISEIGTGDLTSNGFLKRNGSSWTVDTNSYALASALTDYLPLEGGTMTGDNSVIFPINDNEVGISFGTTSSQDAYIYVDYTSKDLILAKSNTAHTGEVASVYIGSNGVKFLSSSALVRNDGTNNHTVWDADNAYIGSSLRTITIGDRSITNIITSADNVAWSKISSTPTTISGYGITDAKIENGVITLGSNTITPVTSLSGYINSVENSGAGNRKYVSNISSGGSSLLTATFTEFPTSISGYGIQDSIPIIDTQDNGTSAAGTWKAKTTPASLITAYTDGMMIRYKLTYAGASTTTLNVNGLGAKTVYRRGTTKLTTHYGVGSYLILYYSTSFDSGSWQVLTDYDANTTYSIISDSELQTGTATTGRTISAARLAANYYISNGTVHIAGNSITPFATLVPDTGDFVSSITADGATLSVTCGDFSDIELSDLSGTTNSCAIETIGATTGTTGFLVKTATNTWTLDSTTYQPYSGMLVAFSNILSQGAGLISMDSVGNLSTISTSSIASFGTEGSDYVPISLNGTSKNVLTQHQDLSAYLQKSALNIIDSGSSAGEYISGITWDSSSAALSVSRGSLSGYLQKSGGQMTGNITWGTTNGYIGNIGGDFFIGSQSDIYIATDSNDIYLSADQGYSDVYVDASNFTWGGSTILTESAAASTYLPLAGGTMSNATTATIKWSQNTWNTTNGWDTWNGQSNTGLAILTSSVTGSGAPSRYAVGLHVGGYYGMQIAVNTDGNMYYRYTKTTPDAWKQLLTTASASSTYLPLTGGTLTGPLHIKTTSTNALSGTDGYIDFTNGSSTIYSRIGANTNGTIALYGSGNIYLRPNNVVGELSSSNGVFISPTSLTYNGEPIIGEKHLTQSGTNQTGYFKVVLDKGDATWSATMTVKINAYDTASPYNVRNSTFELRAYHYMYTDGWYGIRADGQSGSNNVTIEYGYDSQDVIWFAIPFTDWSNPSIQICNVEGGINVSNITISWVSTLTGTSQGTTTAYTFLGYGVAGYLGRSSYNKSDGHLFTTDITCDSGHDRHITVKIEGHIHSNGEPVVTYATLYWSGSSFSVTKAFNLGYALGAIKVGRDATSERFLLWLPHPANYETYYVSIYASSLYGYTRNCIIKASTNEAMLADALSVTEITPISPFLRVNSNGYVVDSLIITYSGSNSATLSLYAPTSGSPSIWLRRGTTSDSYVDWRIMSSGGGLLFDYSTGGTNTTVGKFGKSTVSSVTYPYLRLVGSASEVPSFEFIRGTESDANTDLKLKWLTSNQLGIYSSTSGTESALYFLSSSNFYPATTATISLGAANSPWNNIYGINETLTGTLTTDTVSASTASISSSLTVGSSTSPATVTAYATTYLNGNVVFYPNYYIEFYGSTGNGKISGDSTGVVQIPKLGVSTSFAVGTASTPATSIDFYGPVTVTGTIAANDDITIAYGKKIKFAKSNANDTPIELYCDSNGVLHVSDSFTSSYDISAFTAAGASGGSTTFIKAEVVQSVPQSPDPNTLYLIPE